MSFLFNPAKDFLGNGVSLFSRHAKKLSCHGIILWHPFTIVIHRPKVVLGLGVPLFSRHANTHLRASTKS